MKKQTFDELKASIEQGGAILKGKKMPRRRFTIEEPDVPEIRRHLGLTQEKFAAVGTPAPCHTLALCVCKLREESRGQTKRPGEYRISQNWIGGSNMNDAIFVPPHHSEVGGLMGDLENFLHNSNIHVPALIRVAIAHYQFETIHPFLDGNGRIGRLLITLYLVDQQLLAKPTLYLSAYLEKQKNYYYDNLTLVRMTNNLSHWIRFFQVGIAQIPLRLKIWRPLSNGCRRGRKPLRGAFQYFTTQKLSTTP